MFLSVKILMFPNDICVWVCSCVFMFVSLNEKSRVSDKAFYRCASCDFYVSISNRFDDAWKGTQKKINLHRHVNSVKYKWELFFSFVYEFCKQIFWLINFNVLICFFINCFVYLVLKRSRKFGSKYKYSLKNNVTQLYKPPLRFRQFGWQHAEWAVQPSMEICAPGNCCLRNRILQTAEKNE